jgi:HAD superfamily hydrolase (TIGR01509 family)
MTTSKRTNRPAYSGTSEKKYPRAIRCVRSARRFHASVLSSPIVRSGGKSPSGSSADLTARTTKYYHDDIGALNALPPSREPRATEYVPQMIAIMETLIEDDRDVTMLTNFSTDTFVEAKERFPFLKKPRGVTVSGEVKLIKPDRKIYDLHAETFGLDPSATLFIDDSQMNVDGAIHAGWQAVLFQGADVLKADLAQRGIELRN